MAQAVVGAKDSEIAKVTTISGLKDFQFGAQVGTTSLAAITSTIAPSKEAKVYDTNDLAIEALKNGQIDGLVVDLPTAFYVTSVAVRRTASSSASSRRPRAASTSASCSTRTAR